MIVTIHQPEHLPWLGFIDKMRQADAFVLLDSTQFAKDDFQNRNRIKTPNGSAWLTVPVHKKGRSEQLIRDTQICNDRPWQRRCRALIHQSYVKAPHYAQHTPFLDELYQRTWSNLVDLNVTIIEYLAEQFEIKTQLLTASELGVVERGSTNVNLTICRRLGADVYLSGTFGRQYLDESQFADHDILVRYQDFEHPVYPQLWGPFQSNMSSIDLLLNCGSTSLSFLDHAVHEVNS